MGLLDLFTGEGNKKREELQKLEPKNVSPIETAPGYFLGWFGEEKDSMPFKTVDGKVVIVAPKEVCEAEEKREKFLEDEKKKADATAKAQAEKEAATNKATEEANVKSAKDAQEKAKAEAAKAGKPAPKLVSVFYREDRMLTLPPGKGHNGATLKHGMNAVPADIWAEAMAHPDIALKVKKGLLKQF